MLGDPTIPKINQTSIGNVKCYNPIAGERIQMMLPHLGLWLVGSDLGMILAACKDGERRTYGQQTSQRLFSSHCRTAVSGILATWGASETLETLASYGQGAIRDLRDFFTIVEIDFHDEFGSTCADRKRHGCVPEINEGRGAYAGSTHPNDLLNSTMRFLGVCISFDGNRRRYAGLGPKAIVYASLYHPSRKQYGTLMAHVVVVRDATVNAKPTINLRSALPFEIAVNCGDVTGVSQTW